MPRTKRYDTKALYFAEKLKEKLEHISDHPLTVVIAPMGYGKTTAVSEYLTNSKIKTLWHNVYDGSSEGFWHSFCYAFSEIDKEIADSMYTMGIPADSVLKLELVKLIKAMDFKKETVLVIDDYHFIKAAAVDEFLSFFLRNLPEKLHIVVISRSSFLMDERELILKGFVNSITAETLAFTPEDIVKYYKLCGVAVDEKEIDWLYKYSEGWISVLYLYLLQYVETGSFEVTRGIPLLVRQTVYTPLSEEIKSFLFHVCIFDVFSLGLAEHMWQHKNAEEILSRLIASNSFIKCDRATGKYSFHNIFKSCVEELFEKEPDAFKQSIWERAGLWFFNNKEYLYAMNYFYKAGSFELLITALEGDKGKSWTGEHKELIIRYMTRCPENIRAQHPYAMLVYARRLFTFNERELCQKVCAEFLKNLQADNNLTEKEKNNFLGEFEILLSFTKYNSISKMSEHHKKACGLLTSFSDALDIKATWGFGSPSILYMYYRESGTLAREVDIIKEAMPYYYQLTNGHGSGAEYVMEAEYYYNMGEMEDAEISLHKALKASRDKEQWSIMICAIFLQIKMCIHKKDYPYAANLMNTARDIILENKQYMLLHTIDLYESYMHLLLGQIDKVAAWIIEGNFKNTRLMFPAIPALNIVYGYELLQRKEYTKLISLSEVFFKQAGVYPNLLCNVYIHLHLAAANDRLFRREEAREHLRKALDIAMPDKLYMPFVENGDYIVSLLEIEIASSHYSAEIKKILSLYKEYNLCVQAIIRTSFTNDKFGLTEREQEIAALAAKGFSNKKIGEQLYISENTVKLRLKNIFQKVNIKSRSELRSFYS